MVMCPREESNFRTRFRKPVTASSKRVESQRLADEVRDAARAEMPRREVGERFGFDFGDSWVHRCAVLEARVDTLDVDGARPRGPVAVWVGSIPDRYGRTTPEG